MVALLGIAIVAAYVAGIIVGRNWKSYIKE